MTKKQKKSLFSAMYDEFSSTEAWIQAGMFLFMRDGIKLSISWHFWHVRCHQNSEYYYICRRLILVGTSG